MMNPPRKSADGAMVIKGDPGTKDTDPTFHRGHESITADGWTTVDLPGGVAGVYLQDLWWQTKDAQLGDLVSVIIALVSDNTEVASFGACNVLMARDSAGWSPENAKASVFLTSTLIPAGTKCRIRYFAAGTALGTRELLCDCLVHE